ncbi:MAG TPA: response regulator [Xenococcaceae cyanobacterium]
MTQVNGYQTNYKNPNKIRKVRISIVDDFEMIREGLKIMLQNEADFEVVGVADNGRNALSLIETLRPDVVVIDVKLAELDGISSTKIISERFPKTKVLILSSYNENQYLIKCLEAGAKGYFLKGTPICDVIQGIRAISKGYCQIGPGLLETAMGHSSLAKKPVEHFALFPATGAETDPNSIATSNDEEFASDLSLAVTDDYGELEPSHNNASNALVFKKTPFWTRTLMWTIVGITTIAILGLAIARFKPELLSGEASEPVVEPSIAALPEPTAVSALGHLEPEGEIIQLSVSSAAEGSRIEQLLIDEGDSVQQGQVVAVLDSNNRSRAALESAKADVQIAQANLVRVKAGAKQGDINAQRAAVNRLEAELRGQVASQRATLARLEAELENAQVEYRRHQQLYEEGAISASERDTRRLRVNTVQRQLEEAEETLTRTIETTQVQRSEAQARLASIAEVRPEDVQVATAELVQAQAAVQQAQAALELTEVRSPIDGQVLNVNVRPGEVIGNRGIAALGKTGQMYVVAEVYETDIERVKVGQQAIVTGAAFSEELQGEVAKIGLEVARQDVFNADPLANTDNKVVEVKIRLDPESSLRVASLSNLQVQVVIQL